MELSLDNQYLIFVIIEESMTNYYNKLFINKIFSNYIWKLKQLKT